MRQKRIVKSATEQDVLTGWRHFFVWTKRPGATSAVKRRYRRRERRAAKTEVRHQFCDDD